MAIAILACLVLGLRFVRVGSPKRRISVKLEQLGRSLTSIDQTERRAAASALVELARKRNAAVDVSGLFLNALGQKYAPVRQFAANALASLARVDSGCAAWGHAASNALGQMLLSEPDGEVRFELVQTLKQLANAGCIEGLFAALTSTFEARQRDLCGQVAEHLAQLGVGRAMQPLLDVYQKTEDYEWRYALDTAIRKIAALDDEPALTALAGVLPTGDYRARTFASEVLKAVKWKPRGAADQAAFAAISGDCSNPVDEPATEAARVLLNDLRSKEVIIRWNAAKALSVLRTKQGQRLWEDASCSDADRKLLEAENLGRLWSVLMNRLERSGGQWRADSLPLLQKELQKSDCWPLPPDGVAEQVELAARTYHRDTLLKDWWRPGLNTSLLTEPWYLETVFAVCAKGVGDEKLADFKETLCAAARTVPLEPLFAALRHEFIYISRIAAEALGKAANPRDSERFGRIVTALQEALPVSEPHLQAVICGVLSRLLGKDAANAILQIAAADERGLSTSMVESVTKTGWQPTNCQERVLLALAKHEAPDVKPEGSAAVPTLLYWLERGSRYVRQLAAIGIGEVGDAAHVKPLIAAAFSMGMEYHGQSLTYDGQAMIAVAANLGRDQAVELVSGRVNKQCLAALEILARLGGDRALEIVTNAVDDADDEVGTAAVRALRAVEHKEVLLHALAHGRSPRVRASAAEALGWIGEPRAVPILLELFHQWLSADTLKFDAQSTATANLGIAAARALGAIGDARALCALLTAHEKRPGVPVIDEALVHYAQRDPSGVPIEILERIAGMQDIVEQVVVDRRPVSNAYEEWIGMEDVYETRVIVDNSALRDSAKRALELARAARPLAHSAARFWVDSS